MAGYLTPELSAESTDTVSIRGSKLLCEARDSLPVIVLKLNILKKQLLILTTAPRALRLSVVHGVIARCAGLGAPADGGRCHPLGSGEGRDVARRRLDRREAGVPGVVESGGALVW